MTEYIIEVSDRAEVLAANVNARLAEGYSLVGGVSVSQSWTTFERPYDNGYELCVVFAQAMAR